MRIQEAAAGLPTNLQRYLLVGVHEVICGREAWLEYVIRRATGVSEITIMCLTALPTIGKSQGTRTKAKGKRQKGEKRY